MKSKMGGWENARPFYFFFKIFWKETIIYETFLTRKKNIRKRKEKRKSKNHQQSIIVTYDPAKVVFVITAPGETWAITRVSQCLFN